MEPGLDTLKINEIFFSIQGESLFVGKPTAFIRTAICNLRCSWCDTKYAYWQGTVMTIPEILDVIRKYDTEYVCVTGGEPLGQQGSRALMHELLLQSYKVSLETNGSYSIQGVPAAIVKVVDIKCPGSGESDSVVWENVNMMQPHDQFKFVVSSREDFDWALAVCKTHDLYRKCHILFSPVFEKVTPRELADWILSAQARVTLQIQLHKQIWGPGERGV